jgi:hypothetical protein
MYRVYLILIKNFGWELIVCAVYVFIHVVIY